METGRRSQRLYSLERGRVADPDYRPRRSGRGGLREGMARHIHVNVDRVEAAKTSSILDFWGRVADFAALNRLNPLALIGVRPLHPFIHIIHGKVKVNMAV